MELETLITIASAIFIVGIIGIAIFRALAGPKKLEDIKDLMNRGRFKEAIAELNTYIDKTERDIEAQYLLGYCQEQEKEYTESILAYRQALKTVKFPSHLPETKIRAALARTLEKLGSVNDAKNEYLLLSTIEPTNAEHFYNVGRLFLNARHYQRASNFLSKAAQINPRHGETWAQLGNAQYNLKAYKDAATSLQKGIDLKPDDRMSRYYLGLCLRYNNEGARALIELEKAEKEESIKAKVILAKGLIHADLLDFDKAISELERGLQYTLKGDETYLDLKYLIAACAEKNRDLDRAVKNWDEIHTYRPDFRDVKAKLQQYAEYRTHDTIKDFIIAGVSSFESIVRKIVENLKYEIIDLQLLNDNLIRVTVVEDVYQKKLVRRQNIAIQVQREVQPVTEKAVRDFVEFIKETRAIKGILMVTSEVTPGALAYIASRPVEIFDTGRMSELLQPILH